MKARLLLLSMLLAGCNSKITPQQQKLDIANLPKAFSVLEQLQVHDYRNQDWCKNIAYKYGKFSKTTHPSTCNLFEGTPKSFDSQADRDFKSVAQTIASTGVNLDYLSIEYGKTRKLTKAEFNVTGCGCSYVYSPSYEKLPTNLGREIQYTALSQDWYFVLSDWN
jgi:hypothetical protein